jgi:hypothetical protein
MVQRGNIEDNKKLETNVREVLRTRKFKKVRDLVNEIQNIDSSLSIADIKAAILSLQDAREITLAEPAFEGSFARYVTKKYYANFAFWLSLAAISISLVLIYLLPESGFWSIPQTIVGAIDVLLIPGYGLVGLLFPKKAITLIERLGLGVAVSLVLLPSLWLVIGYSQLKVGLDLVVTFTSATSGALIFGDTYRRFLIARTGKSAPINK